MARSTNSALQVARHKGVKMALIPPFFLDCVVAIGFPDENGKPQYVATGFLYGKFIERVEESRSYQVFLVTNKHVVNGKKSGYLRFNPEADEPAQELDFTLYDDTGTQLWHGHPNPEIDVAAIGINTDILKERGIRFAFFRSDENLATKEKAIELEITEGDGVFVLGFPMGLVGEKRNYVIVRRGSIARIRDALAGSGNMFLIDCSVFPGNSGGPVVTIPEAMSIVGTKSINEAQLIGIVASYVPYRDVAISPQTNRPRIIFEENSGLASVFLIDYVQEIVDIASDKLREKEQNTSVELEPGEDVIE
jgi:S1-C subfamily serine protease